MTIAPATIARRDAAVGVPTPMAATSGRRRVIELTLALLPMGLVLTFTRGTNMDLDIYRGALVDMLHGGSAYDYAVFVKEVGANLGFIYPPFASLVMMPLALVPEAVGAVVMAGVTTLLVMLALLGCIGAIDTHRLRVGRKEVSLLVVALASLPIAVSIPALSNMTLGQISFAIAAVVLIDVTLLPARWRGTLVGLVGAIKLTPMILVPYYLVTRQWRAAINASVAFALATAVSAAVRWSDTIRYLFHPEVVSNSLGNLSRADNWSIYGVLSRFGLDGSTRTVVWLLGSALVLAAALWRARRHSLQGQELEATLVMGLAAGLVMVATWPHHLLFCVVACAVLAMERPAIGFPVLVLATIGGELLPESPGNWMVLLIISLVVLGLPGRARRAPRTTPLDAARHPVPDAA